MNHTLLTAAAVASLITPFAMACEDDDGHAIKRRAAIALPGHAQQTFVWHGGDDLPKGLEKRIKMGKDGNQWIGVLGDDGAHGIRWMTPGENEMHFGHGAHGIAIGDGAHGLHRIAIRDGGDVSVSGRIEIRLPGGKVKVIEFGGDDDDRHGHDDDHGHADGHGHAHGHDVDAHGDAHGAFSFRVGGDEDGPDAFFSPDGKGAHKEMRIYKWRTEADGEEDGGGRIEIVTPDGKKVIELDGSNGFTFELPEGMKDMWHEIGEGGEMDFTFEMPDIDIEGMKGKWLRLGDGAMGMAFDFAGGTDLEDLKAKFGKGAIRFFDDGMHEGHLPEAIREKIEKHMKDARGGAWFTPHTHDAEADVHVEEGEDGTYQIWVERAEAGEADAHEDDDDDSDLEDRLADLQRKLKELQKAIKELSKQIGD